MNRKKIIEAIIAIFIGLLFISSYLTIGNVGGGQKTPSPPTQNITKPQTIFAFGNANVMVSGYNNTLVIDVSCNSSLQAGATAEVGNLISELQQNNSIADYYGFGNISTIQPGKMDALHIYTYMTSKFNASVTNCTKFATPVSVLLPPQVNLYISPQYYLLAVPQNLRTRQLDLFLTNNLSSTIPVKVTATVTLNGTIYQLNITRA